MKFASAAVVLATGALLVSACQDDDDAYAVSVDEMGAGAYVVSTGDANAPTLGRYYAGADGSRLLVLEDADERAQQVYRRSDAQAAWVAVPPASDDVQVKLLRSDAMPQAVLAVASLAGSHEALVAAGRVASFAIGADGTISPGTSACKLSGKLATGGLPNALRFNLVATGCGNALPATSSGAIVVDADFAPARFRMLADDGKTLVDLLAFAA